MNPPAAPSIVQLALLIAILIALPVATVAIGWLVKNQFKHYELRDAERAKDVAELRTRMTDMPRLYVLRDDYLAHQARQLAKLDEIHDEQVAAAQRFGGIAERLDVIERLCKPAHLKEAT